MQKSTLVPTLLAAAVALSFAGCKPRIDGEKAETAIKAGVKAQTGEDLKSLTCPRDLEAKADATFECKGLSSEGAVVIITVTIKDTDGNVAWKLTSVGGQTAPDGSAKAAPAPAPAADEPKAAPAATGEPKDDHKE